MSSHQHSGKPPEGSTREPVDYTDQPTRPAVFIEDEVGQRWETPDKEVSLAVEVNYGAARRRLTRPPGYDLSEHYEAPTAPDQPQPHVPYQGPENFAPTQDDADEVPETLPLDLAIFDDKPFKPWAQNTTTPTHDASTPTPPTKQGARRAAGRSKQLMHAMETTQPAANTPQRRAGGFSGDGPTRGNIAIISAPTPDKGLPQLPRTPPPPVTRRAPAQPTPPQRTSAPEPSPHVTARAQARQPPPPPRPIHSPPAPTNAARPRQRPELRSAPSKPPQTISARHDEPSDVFIADEYEHMALRRSTLQIIVGVLFLGIAGSGLLLLLTLAFFGNRLFQLLLGS